MTEEATAPTNMTELRNTLAETLAELRNGNISVKTATEISNMAGKINATVKSQLEYAKLRKERPDVGFLNCK